MEHTDQMDLGGRIKFAARLLGDRKTAADQIGVSADQLARYIRGENEPKIGPISRLAGASKVSLEWLVRGTGAPGIDEARKQADAEVFVQVAAMFADRCEQVSMPPETFAETLRDLCDFAMQRSKHDGHLDPSRLGEVIDYALLKLR